MCFHFQKFELNLKFLWSVFFLKEKTIQKTFQIKLKFNFISEFQFQNFISPAPFQVNKKVNKKVNINDQWYLKIPRGWNVT